MIARHVLGFNCSGSYPLLHCRPMWLVDISVDP